MAGASSTTALSAGALLVTFTYLGALLARTTGIAEGRNQRPNTNRRNISR
ncbi:hypothetical protein ACWEO2_37790 [Nocardia sp. NPDC004278]